MPALVNRGNRSESVAACLLVWWIAISNPSVVSRQVLLTQPKWRSRDITRGG